MNQEALKAIGEGDFIKFEYKHPVLEGERALFTFVGHEAKTKGETFYTVERLGQDMNVDYIKDGIMKVYNFDMMGQRTTYQFDLSEIEVLGYTFNEEAYRNKGVVA
tara:strand:+ start:420 stop:737 length:318 start_codon:yes stop_codon:yes gene_type:complete